MKRQNNFVEDLENARKFEDEAQRRIKQIRKCTITEIQDNMNYHSTLYDFKTSDNESFEVKADHMCSKTGNCFIEFEQKGRPSGIGITKATHHIIVVDCNYHLISTKQLKKMCKNSVIKKSYTGCKGYLIQYIDLKKKSTLLAYHP